jgi:chromosome segregation ATPase
MGFPWPGSTERALAAIHAELTQLNQKVDYLTSQQAQLDADVQALTAVVTDVADKTATLGTDLTAIAAEIASLQAQIAAGTPVNLAALDALVATAQSTQQGLDSAVSTATGMVPPAPAPAPAPPAPAP